MTTANKNKHTTKLFNNIKKIILMEINHKARNKINFTKSFGKWKIKIVK